jgi:hypothetical protein
MKNNSKGQFIRKYNPRNAMVVEYIKEKKIEGFSKDEIQSQMVLDRVGKSPLAVYRNFKFYEEVKDEIGWI